MNTAARPPDSRKKVHQDVFAIQIAKAAPAPMCPTSNGFFSWIPCKQDALLATGTTEWSGPDITNELIDNGDAGGRRRLRAASEEMEIKTNTAPRRFPRKMINVRN